MSKEGRNLCSGSNLSFTPENPEGRRSECHNIQHLRCANVT